MKRGTVGLDARMWTHPGIGRYIRELSRALLRAAPPSRFVFFGDEGALRPFLGPDATILPASAPIYGIAEQRETARLSRRVGLWHAPHFNAPMICSSLLIATIHDLIYLRQPGALDNPLGRFYVKSMLSHIARHARAILTVSEATKLDFLDLFPGTDASRITVVHEAASDLFRPLTTDDARARLLARFGISKPFALFVGSFKPHKNISTLLQAVHRLRETGLDVEVVLVGRADPKHPEILRQVQSAAPTARHLGELTDDELVHVYNEAAVLVQPSFSEGFGLPVLEAMSCGTPVVVSRRASLPEIAGEAGMYFEPECVDALGELLYTIFKNKDLRQKMSQMCQTRSAQFTWEKTARQTLAVYDRVG